MLNLKKHLIIGLTAAGIGFTAVSSFAQMPPPGGPEGAGPGGHPPSAAQIAKFEQHRAKRQAELHDKLKITAAQEGAWKTFNEKTTPVRPATPPARPEKGEMEKMTTPQRLDRMAEFASKREAEMTARIAAVKDSMQCCRRNSKRCSIRNSARWRSTVSNMAVSVAVMVRNMALTMDQITVLAMDLSKLQPSNILL